MKANVALCLLSITNVENYKINYTIARYERYGGEKCVL